MSPSWPLLAPRAQRCQWSHPGQPWSRHSSSSSCCIAADQATMLTDRVHIQVWDLSPRTAVPYLEGAAGAGLAQPDDAVQIVGGDALVLLLDETERGEVEAGLVALSVFQHRGQLGDGAPVSRRRASWVHVGLPKESRERSFWLTRQIDLRRWSWRDAGWSRCSIGPGAQSTCRKRMRSPAPSQRLQVTGGILTLCNLSRQSNEVGS